MGGVRFLPTIVPDPFSTPFAERIAQARPARVQRNRDHAAELTIMLLVSAREESFDLAWRFLKSPAS
jgi:hypothetical protein